MQVERTRPRISPRDFQDYAVQVTLGDRYFTGTLGNISEDGLCVLLPENARVSGPGISAHGSIQSRQLSQSVDFEGRVAWASTAALGNRKYTLVGVEFPGSIELPASLIALGMSTLLSND